MRSRAVIWAVLAAIATVPTISAVGAADPISATPVVTGLGYPSMFTIAPDGRIFWSELQTGKIGVFTPSTGAKTTFVTISNLCIDADQGLFGIALHPTFPATPDVWAYATRSVGGVCTNQVLRVAPDGAITVLQAEPYTGEHIGGRVAFGPDGKLYVSTGEGGSAANAQDASSTKGKILRMEPDGAAPADNPTPGSLAFASGFRNVFGFDFDPATGQLWATENGPECNDEINLIDEGANYGWGPSATCATPPAAPANTNADGPSPRFPTFWYSPSDGPTGTAFCRQCGLPGYDGTLLYGAWQYGQVRALSLDSSRQHVTGQSLVYTHTSAEAPLSLETGPDGSIYFSDKHAIYRLTGGGSSAPKIAINDPSVVEGDTGGPQLQFTVSLDHASAADVKVQYETRNGSAGSRDYRSTKGTLTIGAGGLTGTVNVTLRPDTKPEGDETVKLKLSRAQNASIADGVGIGTIVDDD
jgi:glucose/arabinose dehydrogenase